MTRRKGKPHFQEHADIDAKIADHDKKIAEVEADVETLADFVADVAESAEEAPPKKRARKRPRNPKAL